MQSNLNWGSEGVTIYFIRMGKRRREGNKVNGRLHNRRKEDTRGSKKQGEIELDGGEKKNQFKFTRLVNQKRGKRKKNPRC